MNYWSKKTLNKQHAIEHLTEVCKYFAKEIAKSIENTEEYTEDDCRMFLIRNLESEDSMGYCISVDFERKGIIEAVLDNKSKSKIAILNFASYKNPGGMYLNGSSAQEECICHSSTLFPVLESFNDTFYHFNRENKNKALYTNRMLYSPDIVIMEGNKKRLVDVITIAAPNRGAALKNGVSEDEIETTMRERIICTLEVAKSHGVKTLFLGAFGCGVFKNNPEVVARIFCDELKKYPEMKFVFPIPDEENYNAFSSILTETFVRGLLGDNPSGKDPISITEF